MSVVCAAVRAVMLSGAGVAVWLSVRCLPLWMEVAEGVCVLPRAWCVCV